MAATRRLNQLAEAVAGVADFPSPPFVVALSGGADSSACAWLAQHLGPTRALHVHHGLASSDLMEVAARAVATTLGMRLEGLRIQVEPWSEGRARQLRYEELKAALEPGEWLLTAHTADDQAETVLANLVRGAGMEGLAGIPARRDRVARPLLAVDRSSLRELATLAELPWRDDPANFDLGPLRNRLRRRLLPQLEAEYNPAFRQHLTEVAQAAAAIEEGRLVPALPGDGQVRLPIPMLLAVSPPLAIRSIREAARVFRHGYSLTRAETDRVWKVVKHTLTSTQLTGGITVGASGPWLVIGAARQDPPPMKWQVPGSVKWGRFRLDAAISDDRPLAMPLSPWHAVLDLDRVGEVLTIRSGGGGAPEMVVGDRIIWEVGRGAHPSGWIDDTTRRYLCVQCMEEATPL